MDEFLETRLLHSQHHHRYRQRQLRSKDEKVFSSSDYLGLAKHPKVIAALKNAVEDYGVSSSSSFVVSGYTSLHQEFELAFADFLNREAALLFSCGYMANLGVFSVLANAKTEVLADKFIHASLIDAISLSKAKLSRFPHRNYAALEKLLILRKEKPLLVTDGVFSMQGELANLTKMVALCEKYPGTLIVDDAHGIGVLGKNGAGTCEHFALSQKEVPVLICPLAKAFGVMGAMVSGPKKLIEALIQFARPYIYTNALPPALAAAGLASLECVRQEKWRREKLFSLIHFFRGWVENFGLPFVNSTTPIQLLPLGSSLKAEIFDRKLQERGFRVGVMRPPTVAEKSACLRISLTALHEEKQLQTLLTEIKKINDDLP